MKALCIFLCLYAAAPVSVYPEIKNGYEQEMTAHRMSLQRLCEILQMEKNLSRSEKKKLKLQIQRLMKFLTCYEMTEKMLDQFKEIAPDLYHHINSLTDINGCVTDVYVKFIPIEDASVQAQGTTSLAHSISDEDTYNSVYGDRTVSVAVCIAKKSLWILAHEFGHVSYQVRNLSSYIKYYRCHYNSASTNPNFIGHNIDDPSGKEAINFERRFRSAFNNYYRYRKEKDLISPINLMASIRTNLAEGMKVQ